MKLASKNKMIEEHMQLNRHVDTEETNAFENEKYDMKSNYVFDNPQNYWNVIQRVFNKSSMLTDKVKLLMDYHGILHTRTNAKGCFESLSKHLKDL